MISSMPKTGAKNRRANDCPIRKGNRHMGNHQMGNHQMGNRNMAYQANELDGF